MKIRVQLSNSEQETIKATHCRSARWGQESSVDGYIYEKREIVATEYLLESGYTHLVYNNCTNNQGYWNSGKLPDTLIQRLEAKKWIKL